MAYLDNTTQRKYYEGRNFGNYQFVSLEDVINQFMVIYVGDDKIIPKVRKLDVAFHAQRALAELSFDTFKSVKSQQIDLPPSLTMILPHDYVNYTKISQVDTSGIKHLLYPTKHTSNPFQIRQDANGQYDFDPMVADAELVTNYQFDDGLVAPWYFAGQGLSTIKDKKMVPDASVTPNPPTAGDPMTMIEIDTGYSNVAKGTMIKEVDGVINFIHSSHGFSGRPTGKVQILYQELDVTNVDFLDLKGSATTQAATTTTWTLMDNPVKFQSGYALRKGVWSYAYVSGFPYNNGYQGGIFYNEVVDAYNVAFDESLLSSDTNSALQDDIPDTTIRIGICSQLPDENNYYTIDRTFAGKTPPTAYLNADIFDLKDGDDNPSYKEWEAGVGDGEKQVEQVDVREHDTVYVLTVSIAPFETHAWHGELGILTATNTVDDISVKATYAPGVLTLPVGNREQSSTWKNYKSNTPNENTVNNYDYNDDHFDLNLGQRYGLEPSHAQINGSFFIDERLGKIHFSSNVSGKTVILDYISDSLGTEAEMKVHKFAEDAIYKHILCGVMSAQRGVSAGALSYYKRDKWAATRNAKLRLSNIKLEEITQILRGKSKHIKH